MNTLLVFKEGAYYLKHILEEVVIYCRIAISEAIYLEDNKGFKLHYE